MSVYRPRDKAGKLKSPYWQFDFEITLPNGERRRFFGSTGLEKKADAEEFERQKRRREALGTGPGELTVDDGCWKYWDELAQDYKGNEEAARNLEYIRTFLGVDERGYKRRLIDLTTDIVRDAIRARAAKPIVRMVREDPKDPNNRMKVEKIVGLPSGPTINRSFTKPLAALIRRAESAWDVPINSSKFPWKELLYPESESRGRELGSAEEERFWSSIRVDLLPAIWFLANRGPRIGGLLSMRKSRTNLEAGTTQVLRKTKKKGEHWQTLKLTRAQIAVLATEMARAKGDVIWTYEGHYGKNKGKRLPIVYSGLRMYLDRMLKRAGIADFTIHTLRHDYGSKLLRVTGNLKLASEALGHSNVAITAQFYAHVQDDEIAAGSEMVEQSRNSPGFDFTRSARVLKKN
jgi:integrase